MNLIKGMCAGRARWLTVFVVLLCASCAAPVLAKSTKMGVGPARVVKAPARAAEIPSPPEGEAPPSAETAPPAQGPIAEELEVAESDQAARDEWLDSPEAIRQREESRTAFDDLIAADAEGVLGSVFQEVLKRLDGDPSRLISDVQIEEVVSENGALIPDGEGGSQLLELPIPIRSQVPGKEAKPVDLSLKESEGGFESKTPATDIRLPGTLGGQIEIGDELAISELPGNAEVAASRYGDTDLFFANSDTDTDTFIATLTKGVEIFEQLRSPKSPEQFRYGLTLPQGTTLRSDGNGGAEVVNAKEERVAFVPAPFAVDAQGTNVPVSMEVEGNSVLVSIPHRSMDIAYPLLLDPELVYDAWYWHEGNTSGLGYWGWQESADYENGTWCVGTCWGNGLYARSKGSNYWYGPNTWGQWIYTAPNSTAYISRAVFWTLFGNVHNCYTNHPHGYVGIYNVYSGSYNNLGIYSPPSFFATSYDTGWAGGNGTRLAVVGIGTGGSASQLACGHDFYVGGAALYQDDPENPGVSASGMPGGWISDTTPAFTIHSNGSDPGLGVRKTTFGRDGQPVIERPVGCNGTAASRCPVNRNEQFNVSALSFDEGKKNAYMTVEDATVKKSTQTWQTYIDMTKPDVTLSGQLAVATEEDEGDAKDEEKWDELSLPVYNLNIKATDIGTEQNADYKKRSGVRRIEVLLDGVKKQEWEQSCPASSCSMEKSYPLKLNNLSADKHVLKVIATDWVGKKREREIEFEYIPATGMKDEYVMQYFPLPDGEGNEAEEENPARPELAVNVMNGNLVYREKDIDVEGYAVDLEVERYYNSLLPEAENTEWGDGWTLAQAPDLEPEEAEGPPQEAMMVRASGAVEGSVGLPTETGAEEFDPELQAVVTKEPDGGYGVADATGETDTTVAFDSEGNVDELRTEGLAKVDYAYEEEMLSEIAVDDPASTDMSPEEAAEHEEINDFTPYFESPIGTPGEGDGELDDPNDVALAPDGTVWVVDSRNDRVQHFSAEGEFLDKFGSTGTGDGQFRWPVSVAIDSEGDIWVGDMNNDRVQQFDEDGEFLSKFGSSGEGQIRYSRSLAIDANDHIWVADAGDHVIKEFNQQGEFIKQIGRKPGQDGFLPPNSESLGQPLGVDIAPNGDVWVADTWGLNHNGWSRVLVYNQAGEFLHRFGSRGSDPGKFASNDSISVDDKGYAWVGDSGNHRVQVFNQAGKYITEFGEAGSGEGQFAGEYAMRIAFGGSGDVWVVDAGNGQVQRWKRAGRLAIAEGAKLQDDPKVEVIVDDGLVGAVEGKEAGLHLYGHEDELLTAHVDADGATEYDYDQEGRMTRVELPNGTWAEIEYGETDGRVKKVTVDPEGSDPEKSTTFSYTDQPRSTKVILPDAPAVTYDIGEDGSVFKWQNALKPPEFEVVSGTLYDVENKETAAPIAVGDYNLVVKAYSEEGIASIQVYANGDQLISEKTCPQIDEEPEACKKLPDEWVTYTGNHAPGILNLEMVIEDGIEQVASKRFWVNIPYTPPPPPGEPEKPLFYDVLKFREEHGLDLDLDPVQDEFEINDRVFDTINDWVQGKPVAVASMERWGVPFRTPEVAELEYREWFYNVNTELIDQWVQSTSPSSYAGNYLNHQTGGIMYVGFTADQNEQLNNLMASLPLVAKERLQVYPTTPTASYFSVQEASQSVSNAIDSNATLRDLVVNVSEDEAGKAVRVGTLNVAQVESILVEMLGPSVPVVVEYDAGGGSLLSGRFRNEGRMRAGDAIFSKKYTAGTPSVPKGNGSCTAGFGAKDNAGKRRGRTIWRLFVLTAGHCNGLNSVYEKDVYRSTDSNPENENHWKKVGEVTRDALHQGGSVSTDAAAIRVRGSGVVPQGIFGWHGNLIPTNAARKVRKGSVVCFSGAKSQSPSCGRIVARSTRWIPSANGDGYARGGYWVKFNKPATYGDSGAPVWAPAWAGGSNASVGLVTAGRPEGSFTETLVEPLLHPHNLAPSQVVGILHNQHMAPLSLKLGR
jgi:YD repeat-containing protein